MSVNLYHYTSEGGATGIIQSGYVHPSTGKKHQWFGPGVYLTTKAPGSNNMEQIAENNYTAAARHLPPNKKLQVALQFKIPKSEVQQVDSQRDVWRYSGENLSLANYGTNEVWKRNATGAYSKDNGWYLA